MYLLSELASPWTVFEKFSEMSASLHFTMKDHILPRHEYVTDDEAEKYRMRNNNKYIKSRFSDYYDYYDIYQLIILAIIHPTKVTTDIRIQDNTATWAIIIDKR